MYYYVYILQSLKDQKFYIGHTQNLERRIQEHTEGKTRSLKGRVPFKLVYKESFLDRSGAVTRERQIKRYKGGNAFKQLVSGPIV